MLDRLVDHRPAAAGDFVDIGGRQVVWTWSDYATEYAALREGAGLFDLGHAGRLRVTGDGAVDALQRVLARDVEFLAPERAMTAAVLTEDGAPFDIVTVLAGDDDYLVQTGAGRAAGLTELLLAEGGDVEVADLEPETALFLLEGPLSWRVLASVFGEDCLSLAYESTMGVSFADVGLLLARTGVTGEYGYTLVVPDPIALLLWDALISAGATTIGAKALETAMFEVRQPVLHRELEAGDSVLTAGLNWLVDLTKDSFLGREAVEHSRTLVTDADSRPIAIAVVDGTAAVGDELLVDGETVGRVVTLVDSLGRDQLIGLAKVNLEWQAAELTFETSSGAKVLTLSPPYVVPRSWTTPIQA